MKDETSYQHDIIKAVVALGGWGKKLSNRFLIGIPDLGIVLRPFGQMIIEVKKVEHAASTNRPVNTGLTDLQSINLRDIAKSGGNCGVLLLAPGDKRGTLKVGGYFGPAETYIPKEFHECALIKSPTNRWENLLPILLPVFLAPDNQ